MLGDSATALEGGASSGDAVAAAAAAASAAEGGGGAHEGAESAAARGDGSSLGEEDGGGDRSFGGNRWPRQETLALLKIRSDMDVAFRDASVKGPLWEEVSRKLAELGYHRNAKKCKEKFENVYKYHKRTKEGRTGKPDGKTYRFFDQLEALHHQHQLQLHNSSAPLPAPPLSSVVIAATQPPPLMAAPQLTANPPPSTTVPSMNTSIPPLYPPQPQPPPQPANPTSFIPSSFASIPTDLLSNSSLSMSTSSDETMMEAQRRKRKRKWKDFFERLMKEVIEKQEELQRRFLEAIEKREHERMVREEAWRMQEMTRINKEREILAQERSIAAAKDAAVMAFLQKIAEQQNLGAVGLGLLPPPPPPPPMPMPNINIVNNPPAAPAPPPPQPQPTAVQQQQQQPTAILSTPRPPPPLPPPPTSQQVITTSMNIITKDDNGENNNNLTPSSRWPKLEVETLIKLRTNLDAKYLENGPKGPLWEEISAAMRRHGYNRSAKRCKEKWENINKYFKKVKESNKRRPEDSKTCPYFHQLDALYREKNFKMMASSTPAPPPPTDNTMAAPLMVRPEQQWPPQQQQPHETQPRPPMMENAGNIDDAMEEDEEERDEEEEDEEDEGGSSNYEIVASKPATSVGTSE